MKQYLDQQQAKKLIELGVDMGDTMLISVIDSNGDIQFMKRPFGGFEKKIDGLVPTFTIGELIDRMPSYIVIDKDKPFRMCYDLEIKGRSVSYSTFDEEWLDEDQYSGYYEGSKELIDNLFDCYLNLIKDGLVELK